MAIKREKILWNNKVIKFYFMLNNTFIVIRFYVICISFKGMFHWIFAGYF